MCSRPKLPPAPPPPPELPPAPPPPPPALGSLKEETGQMRPGRAGTGIENIFSILTKRRGKSALTIPRA